MKFLSKHWFDMGGLFAIIVVSYLSIAQNLSAYRQLMWLSLVSLFLHQLEEYRIVGTFPEMVNKVMYRSTMPDRYPLNAKTSVYINVFIGWGSYSLAAIFGEQAIWLGIATILISAGNLVAHTFIFNIKGETLYNAGLATSWLFFAPCIYFFFHIVYRDHLISTSDYFIGVPLGITLNVIGILKLIDWLADKETIYIFKENNLMNKDRKKTS